MSIVLRPGTVADAAACGTICYEAFKAICTAHNFPPDFPSPEVASGLLSMLLAHPGFYSVAAEGKGRIIGSNFLDERSCVAGVGPITVDPTGQNRGAGGRLMQGCSKEIVAYVKWFTHAHGSVDIMQGCTTISGLRSEFVQRGHLRRSVKWSVINCRLLLFQSTTIFSSVPIQDSSSPLTWFFVSKARF
jgi:hypothetical protein